MRRIFGQSDARTKHQDEDRKQFLQIRDTILRVLQEKDPTVREFTSLDRRPLWQRQEWAHELSPHLPFAVSAQNIEEQRTVAGLAHWLYRSTLNEATIASLRQQGF